MHEIMILSAFTFMLSWLNGDHLLNTLGSIFFGERSKHFQHFAFEIFISELVLGVKSVEQKKLYLVFQNENDFVFDLIFIQKNMIKRAINIF